QEHPVNSWRRHISPERKKQLNDSLLLFFTGFTRFSADVQTSNHVTAINKRSMLKQTYELVDEAEKILINKEADLNEFGAILDVAWKLKRQTGKRISTEAIDCLYQAGIAAGAKGGKLLGAGGGGFLVFYVEPDKKIYVKKALANLLYIPFSFENDGVKVIHYSPEVYIPV
ncbi:MAG: kinase, partial [Clostridia bacterium]|nr:kinase [Clostridia bacterium]